MTSLPEHSGPSVVHEEQAVGAREIEVIGAGSVGRVLTGRLSAAGPPARGTSSLAQADGR